MEKRKKKNRVPLILAILVCLILVAGITAACVMYLNLENESETKESRQPVDVETLQEQTDAREGSQNGSDTGEESEQSDQTAQADPRQVDATVNEIAERWNQSSSFIRSAYCVQYADDTRTDYCDKDGKAVRFVQERDGTTLTYLFGDEEELIYIYVRDGEGQTFHYFYQEGSLICYRSGMGRNYAPFEEEVQNNSEQYYQNGVNLLADRLKDREEKDEDKDDEKKDGSDLAEENPGDYIIPESSKRLLTEEDLEGLSSEQLRLARNEIFARHGRIFGSSDLQEYFESKSWYKGTADSDEFQDSSLSEIESKNVEFILAHE